MATKGTSIKNVVLFLHGLESGVNGSKANFLKASFPDARVVVPDLEMSALDPRRRNSFLRTLSVRRSLRNCCDIALRELKMALRQEQAEHHEGVSSTSAVDHALDVVVDQDLVSSNFFTPAETTFLNQNLVVVGSSWGGACGLCLLDRGLRPRKMILLAPAIRVFGGWAHFWPGDAYFVGESSFFVGSAEGPHLEASAGTAADAGQRSVVSGGGMDHTFEERSTELVVIHGDADDMVPVEGSRDLATQHPDKVRYIEIAGGDHRLNAAVIDTGLLREIILE